jgi:hypothetical protein
MLSNKTVSAMNVLVYQIGRNRIMDEREILLMMTLCELLGKTVKERDVLQTYEKVIGKVKQEREGPKDAR